MVEGQRAPHRIRSRRGRQTPAMDAPSVAVQQKLFQVTFEELDQVLRVLAKTARKPSARWVTTPDGRSVAKSALALRLPAPAIRPGDQPAIDPIREAIVMSLNTCFGPERNLFEEAPDHARRIEISSPLLSHDKFIQITASRMPNTAASVSISTTIRPRSACAQHWKPWRRKQCRQSTTATSSSAVRPRHRQGPAADPRRFRHRLRAPRPDPCRAALQRQYRGGNRHSARPAPFRLPYRLMALRQSIRTWHTSRSWN